MITSQKGHFFVMLNSVVRLKSTERSSKQSHVIGDFFEQLLHCWQDKEKKGSGNEYFSETRASSLL